MRGSAAIVIVLYVCGGVFALPAPEVWDVMPDEARKAYESIQQLYMNEVERIHFHDPLFEKIQSYAETKLDNRFNKIFQGFDGLSRDLQREKLELVGGKADVSFVTVGPHSSVWDMWLRTDVKLARIDVRKLKSATREREHKLLLPKLDAWNSDSRNNIHVDYLAVREVVEQTDRSLKKNGALLLWFDKLFQDLEANAEIKVSDEIKITQRDLNRLRSLISKEMRYVRRMNGRPPIRIGK